MRRLALATATLLALVTGAVTPAHSVGEPWHIYATVSVPNEGSHQAFYVYDGKRVNFPDQAACEHILSLPQFDTQVKVPFEASEHEEHGDAATILWACVPGQVPGQDI